MGAANDLADTRMMPWLEHRRCLQDWDAIAKKDNLDEMSTELRRLEAMVREIHDEMLFLRTREEEMRNLNGTPSGPGH